MVGHFRLGISLRQSHLVVVTVVTLVIQVYATTHVGLTSPIEINTIINVLPK